MAGSPVEHTVCSTDCNVAVFTCGRTDITKQSLYKQRNKKSNNNKRHRCVTFMYLRSKTRTTTTHVGKAKAAGGERATITIRRKER
ncbi:hypothetical protein TRSC58_07613 [Trypanosoma rangeli SC58]|uniref:Uncharacterized protein n=1 Tax=Trypanosoma rangeli SC58 TaxID=429131 RepID=A0A061ISU2_TRYRA|nr:hypothetical protein TRSC58_07613 [Trypanosoma rangeli SC58]